MQNAQALVIHCIDFRFQSAFDEDLKKRGLLGKFDRISTAGASKDFESVKRSAEASIKFHTPGKILIYEHEDCAAYREDNSEKTHKDNAQKLANALKKIKPSLKIEILIATFDEIKPLA